ncbi:MAG TPA: hypothetical protein VIR98_00485 [Candidatus Paceibacterota bacterium]
MNYANTLIGLAQRARYHEKQLTLLRAAQAALESGESVTYEVQIQQDMPYNRAIMAQGESVDEAFKKAQRLYVAYGRGSHPCPELFVLVADLRIAIDPADICNPQADFKLDKRIMDYPNQMVFGSSDEMPSWHTNKPTPEPESELQLSRR